MACTRRLSSRYVAFSSNIGTISFACRARPIFFHPAPRHACVRFTVLGTAAGRPTTNTHAPYLQGYRKAAQLAVARLNEIAVGVEGESAAVRRALLEKCAKTALNSKLISRYQDFFAPMIVDAVESIGPGLDLSMIGVKKVHGGSVTESFLVRGVAFKRTFSYAGFEQQPKQFARPKILLLNLELELKSEKENAEVRIEDPAAYQSIVDAEWNIIYEKLRLCVESGANIILSKLPIGDLGTQYFADRGVFCAGRVALEDLTRVARATGARVQTTVHGMTPEVLGTCERFEERQVGAERYNLFTGFKDVHTATMVLRGGAEQFIDETERSIHDSIMIVKNCVRSTRVVAGGGAVEMEISRHLKDYSRTIEGKLQLVISAFAKALEMIPRQLADNAGFDSTDILNRLRQKHAQAGYVIAFILCCVHRLPCVRACTYACVWGSCTDIAAALVLRFHVSVAKERCHSQGFHDPWTPKSSVLFR